MTGGATNTGAVIHLCVAHVARSVARSGTMSVAMFAWCAAWQGCRRKSIVKAVILNRLDQSTCRSVQPSIRDRPHGVWHTWQGAGQ